MAKSIAYFESKKTNICIVFLAWVMVCIAGWEYFIAGFSEAEASGHINNEASRYAIVESQNQSACSPSMYAYMNVSELAKEVGANGYVYAQAISALRVQYWECMSSLDITHVK